MQMLPADTKRIIDELEQEVAREGLSEHLAAARELARDGLPAAQIDFMLRGVFSEAAIGALLVEAASQKLS